MNATTATFTKIDPDSVRITSAIARPKDTPNRWSSVPKTGKVKVYVWINDDAFAPEGMRYPRRDEYTSVEEYDAAFTAYDRPLSRAWVAARREAMTQVLDAFGIDLGKARHSRTAGCSCGCSAGFITEATGQYDYYITATAKPAA